MDNKTSLSVQEVADLLDISKNTVYELIKRQELPSYRIGRKVRIDYSDIELYKNKTRTDKSTNHSVNTLNGSYQISPYQAQNTTQYSFSSYESTKIPSQDNLIVCGQDVLLDILTRYLGRSPYNIPALRSYIGSYNGLIELYKGTVTIASAHLWNGDTGSYNIPYLRSLLPGFSCLVINLTYRMQGFYVVKGNPKNIQSWHDLTRPDVTMINREIGCGVRVLVDESLRKHNISKYDIKGYQNTDFSHLAVASTVSRGEADVAVGNEKTALQVDQIDFVPIQKERLDLIIPKDFIHDSRYRAILEILNSKSFHAEMEGIGGYDTVETGKIIAEI